MPARLHRRHPLAAGAMLLAAAGLLALVQFHLLTLAFESLGLSMAGAAALVVACGVGSLVDLPVFRWRARGDLQMLDSMWWLEARQWREPGGLVMVNLGGALVPAALALYLLVHRPIPALDVAVATALVAAAARAFSRVEPEVGVTLPMFVAPLCAAGSALLLDLNHAGTLAYVSGTLGVLLGADVLRLGEAVRGGADVVSIGGGGTSDGIFLTGLIAVLLA
jgi:uncharacterized membrane protein